MRTVEKRLTEQYISNCTHTRPPICPYSGSIRSPLYSWSTDSYIRRALTEITKRTTTCRDGIPFKFLEHVDDTSISTFGECYNNNKHGEGETLPPVWKQPETIPLPIPGKTPSIQNASPIPLHSCIVKVTERATLDRQQDYECTSEIFQTTTDDIGTNKRPSYRTSLLP